MAAGSCLRWLTRARPARVTSLRSITHLIQLGILTSPSYETATNDGFSLIFSVNARSLSQSAFPTPVRIQGPLPSVGAADHDSGQCITVHAMLVRTLRDRMCTWSSLHLLPYGSTLATQRTTKQRQKGKVQENDGQEGCSARWIWYLQLARIGDRQLVV